VFTRATDNDQTPELGQGDLTYVLAGTANGGNGFVQTSVVTSVGTSSITWSQFSGTSSILAGAGLVQNGTNPNQLDVNVGSTLSISSDIINLATTAVSANSYGSSTAVPSFTVDAYGRLTAASSAAYADATTSTKGVASFSSSQFTLTSGAASITSLAGSVINSGLVGPTYGGTGVNNGTKTITLGGNLTTSGAFTTTLTVTGNTSVTLPTTGTLTSKVTGAGTGTGTAISVAHGLGQWVTAQLYDNTTGALVEVDQVNTATSGGTTTFTFAASQTLTNYTYVIVG
jgi:hypothetical protein